MRITSKQIHALALRVNKALGLPEKSMRFNPHSRQHESEVGHIYVSKDISGYKVEQIVNVGGGARTYGPEARMTAREVHLLLQGIVQALEEPRPYAWGNQPAPADSIDLTNLKVTCAIAGVINGALETGISGGEWFEVNADDDTFRTAYWCDTLPNQPVGEPEDGKGPVVAGWSVKMRLRDPDGDGGEFEWTTLTPALCVQRWRNAAKHGEGLDSKCCAAYLRYLEALSLRQWDKADDILMQEYQPDGVHDDLLAQIAVHGEVIFG